MTALVASGVGVRFGSRTVLDDVSLTLAPGELVVVQGPSGAGKSCLLAVLGGRRRPDTGTVLLYGTHVDVTDVTQKRLVGLLLQGLGLLPFLTAEENVEVPLQVTEPPQRPVDVRE